MRRFIFAILVATLLAIPSAIVAPVSAADCQFVLGFKALHDAIPDKVCDCTSGESRNPTNGDGLQTTTAWHGKGGLLVWRKADNWTAFTDGANTWINGPNGVQSRPNSDRFSWEGDYAIKFQPSLTELPEGYSVVVETTGPSSNEDTAKGWTNSADALALFAKNGREGGYQSQYQRSALSAANAQITVRTSTYRSAAGAQAQFSIRVADTTWQPVSALTIGEESYVISKAWKENGYSWTSYSVQFRRGTVLGQVTTIGLAGLARADDALSVARTVDAKIR